MVTVSREFVLAAMFLGLMGYIASAGESVIAPGEACAHVKWTLQWAGAALMFSLFGLSLWIVFDHIVEAATRPRRSRPCA